MEITRPTVLEVDINAFKHNVEEIKKRVGDGVTIMPVIKANAYGTYLNKRLDILNLFDIVAVAIVDEAVEIRKLGYTKDIFVLNQPYEDEISKIEEYDITIGLSSESFLEALANAKKNIKVHIEIGTGMGRTGIHPKRVKEFIEKINKHPNVIIEGMYTHLSSADVDDEYTRKQIKSFEFAIEEENECNKDLKFLHSSASNGILNYSNTYYNLIRPGIILYGYGSYEDATNKVDIIPTIKLKSKVTYIKIVKEGISIGYSRSYKTTRETKVATVPIGYADGLRRALSNNGEVVIAGKKAPIIGCVCMDSIMVDITDLENVCEGDDVYIWDNKNITLEEVAKKCDTINYEIMCTISDRVPRVFKI